MLAQLVEAGEHGAGVGTAGVTTRWRSLTGLPVGSSSMALRPEPPISMVMVMGPGVVDEARRGSGGRIGFGSHQHELYCAGNQRAE